jgi:hypothetical protein
LWLKKGWIDYVTPQLYLEIGHDKIAYEKLLDWWSKHSYGKHVYIGHGIYRAGEASSLKWKNPNELPNQIKLLRETPNVQGSIYFSSKSFEKNFNGWNDSLRNNYYKEPALVPATPWLSKSKPTPPQAGITAADGKQAIVEIQHDAKKNSNIKCYVVYKQSESTPSKTIAALLPVQQTLRWTDTLKENDRTVRYWITAVNQTNEESAAREKIIKRSNGQTWSIQ